MSQEVKEPLKETNQGIDLDVEQVYSKTEKYIEDNKKSLSIIIGVIIVIVGGYFGYKKLIMEPQELEAQKDMFMAESYFEKDSVDKAINGDGNFFGFKYIVDEYSSTKCANLAHYYLGCCYMKKGSYDMAISEFKEFESTDMVLAPIAVGATGDAYMELGKTEEAIEYYMNASKIKSNNFTSPIYLMKAGLAYEDLNNYANALKIYEQIKSEYATTTEGRNIDKYIARAKSSLGQSNS